MSNRLDQDREQRLQPKRMQSCKEMLESMDYEVTQIDQTKLQFYFKGSKITLYPYSGWYTGKTIKDGRGFHNLLNQLGEDDEQR